MGAAARVEASDSFRIKGRGEAVIYRELEGSLTVGAEVVAEQRGDRWRVTSFGPFFGSPHHEGELPPAFLFQPLGDARRIQAGETFRAVRSSDDDEAYETSAPTTDQDERDAITEAHRRDAELSSGAMTSHTHSEVRAAQQVLERE